MGQTEPMETGQWMNRGQPQTLQVAVFLMYANAVFLVIDMLRFSVFPLLFLLVAAGSVVAGNRIANERKLEGYALGLVMAFSPFLIRWYYFGLGDVFSTSILSLMFEVALIVLLLHPQSRDYQRIWFK